MSEQSAGSQGAPIEVNQAVLDSLAGKLPNILAGLTPAEQVALALVYQAEPDAAGDVQGYGTITIADIDQPEETLTGKQARSVMGEGVHRHLVHTNLGHTQLSHVVLTPAHPFGGGGTLTTHPLGTGATLNLPNLGNLKHW